MVVATVLGWGLVVNNFAADASWNNWQGYLLEPLGLGTYVDDPAGPYWDGNWPYANLGVLLALVLSFVATWSCAAAPCAARRPARDRLAPGWWRSTSSACSATRPAPGALLGMPRPRPTWSGSPPPSGTARSSPGSSPPPGRRGAGGRTTSSSPGRCSRRQHALRADRRRRGTRDARRWSATTFGKWTPELREVVGEQPTLVVAGVATDCCVISTVLAAADAGASITVVTDACAGSTDENHQKALDVMALYGPLVTLATTDEVLAAGLDTLTPVWTAWRCDATLPRRP